MHYLGVLLLFTNRRLLASAHVKTLIDKPNSGMSQNSKESIQLYKQLQMYLVSNSESISGKG